MVTILNLWAKIILALMQTNSFKKIVSILERTEVFLVKGLK